MTRLIDRFSVRSPSQPSRSWDGIFDWFGYGGSSYPIVHQTAPGEAVETVNHAFVSYVQQVYQRSGPVFAVMAARRRVVSQARFVWQRQRSGQPSGIYSTPDLELLRTPWPGATSADLIGRALHHADLAGNAFVYRRGDGQLRLLRPDWVTIVRGGDDPDDPDMGSLVGYLYEPQGGTTRSDPKFYAADEVAHFAPEPDPFAQYRGMSWLRPIIGNVQAHQAAATHKTRFFSNGATPNMVIKFDPSVAPDKLEAYQRIFDERHAGARNAYRTLFLGGGGDPEVVGADFKQMSFKETQGADETMIAAAGGVPPVIVGFSEGLDAATYSNYGQAKDHFRETTVYSLLENLTASLETIIRPAADSRLWFDLHDIPFFREDTKKEAEILEYQSRTIRHLVDAGFTPESVIDAVQSNDMARLSHTGLYSVQLQPAGADPNPEGAPDA